MDDVPPEVHDDPPAPARRGGPRWLQRLDKSPVQRGLTLASIDGAVIGVMAVVIEAWLVPLLQHRLGASAQAIGLLTIVPMLTASVLGPIVAPIIAALGGNKRALLATIAIQILALALLSLPIHAPDSAWSLPTALTLCIAILSCGAIANPAWLAWMSDFIPPRIRGRYSSGRMRLFGFVRLISAVVFMLIMQRWLPEDSAVGLQILLALGFTSRLISYHLIKRQPELPSRVRAPRGTAARIAAERGRGFVEFLRSIHRTDLGRWTLVWAILHAGTMLAGPYFAPYMLAKPEEGGLGLTPVGYTVLVFTAQVVRMLMFPLAGRLVDHYGPSAMLRVAIAGIVVLPMGWALSTSFTVLIIAEICSGLAWCIAECAVGVLLLGCTNDPQDRARMIGYHQAVCCIVIVFTSTIGGQLLHILPPLDGSTFRALFIVSLFARIPALLLAIRFLPELKDPEKLQGLWRLIPGLQPTITLSKGLVRAFRRQ